MKIQLISDNLKDKIQENGELKSGVAETTVAESEYNKFNAIKEKMESVQFSLTDLDKLDFSKVIVEALMQGKSIGEANQLCVDIDDKKAQLQNELRKVKLKYAALSRQKTEEEQSEKIYKYYCSICLIIREDNEYLEEWLDWHVNQGIEHFYIYDHGSKKPIAETIGEMGQKMQQRVTVTDFSGSHGFAQHEAYNDCLNRYGQESRWIAFIDSDEMIRVKNGTKLTEFLKDYEPYAGLFMTWIIYGANGHRHKSNEPCRVRFTSISPSNASANIGKVIVQPAYIKQMLTHNGYTKDGFIVVDEHKEPVDEAQPYKAEATTDLICVDHYYTKSYEEWLNKIKRGSCDPYYNRKYEEFFEYNPDMEYCRENTYPVQEYEISKI